MIFLSIDDICEMLSISRRTLERMRSPSSKFSRELNSVGVHLPEIDRLEHLDLMHGVKRERIYFPEPDLNIGSSPRWEKDKLLAWLKKNGSRL